MRVAVLGNSGSGKSTLSRWLAGRSDAPMLDLDTVAWVPGAVAVPRSPDDARADVTAFCAAQAWIIEGCYESLIAASFVHKPLLIFVNPGVEQCVANCQAREWEPHKYASKAKQDDKLAFLLAWVRDYYTRQGPLSLQAHRACYDGYTGPKIELTEQMRFDRVEPELRRLLHDDTRNT